MPIRISCGDPVFDALPEAFAEWWTQSALSFACGVTAGGVTASGAGEVCGAKSDKRARIDFHEYSMSSWGGAFFANDLKSSLDVVLSSPLPDGSLFSNIEPLPTENHDAFAFNDHLRHLRLSRESLHADNESNVVMAFFRAWQTSNDNAWLLKHLPTLQRAIEYSFAHPHRWSGELELPKRDFTLDRWPNAWGDTRENAPDEWSAPPQFPVVHAGDAARLFVACEQLAQLCAAVGQASDEERWRERAAHLQAQLNSIGWNGQFYTHAVHLMPLRVRGVDEARQLAACNTFVMNSGIAESEQCAAILREYQRRRELNLENSFCEWWSVQPPFPTEHFGVEKNHGANGGIWPLVGGELARAALRNGFESLGVETLRRFHELAVVPRRSFACYGLDGAPERNEYSISHDVVGASCMLRALVEGVCGVVDKGATFSDITLAPRWPATGHLTSQVEVSYAAHPNDVTYRWALDGGRMTLDYESKAKHVAFDLLLPRGNTPERVAFNGRTHEYTLATVEKSKYVRFETDKKRGAVAITLK